MPTIGSFHSKFWGRQNRTAPGGLSARFWMYPAWQASVVIGSLFGPIAAWWEVQYARWQWWKVFARRVHRLSPEQRTILLVTLDTLESPTFPEARTAVRQTAVLIGFRDPAMWKGLSHLMKADVNHCENVFRHLEASRRTRLAFAERLPNPHINLAVELAYAGFAALRR